MKRNKSKISCKRGFTLIELLVVVLIIGILAAVAVPQYQVAVEKARVAQILPMMRHIYDSLAFYKLQNGKYYKGEENNPYLPTWDDLGIECPSGFECDDFSGEIANDTWYCFPNEELTGYVYCLNKKHSYIIQMWQPDEPNEPELAGKRACILNKESNTLAERLCKSLGKPVDGYENYYLF